YYRWQRLRQDDIAQTYDRFDRAGPRGGSVSGDQLLSLRRSYAAGTTEEVGHYLSDWRAVFQHDTGRKRGFAPAALHRFIRKTDCRSRGLQAGAGRARRL